MSETGGKNINLGFLTSITGGSKERMAKYINMFLQHAPGLVSQLDTHLLQGDWPALKTAAHTLKSQFSYMGVSEGQNLAKEVERLAMEQSDLGKVPEHVEKIKTVFQQTCDELKQELTTL